MGYGAMCNHAVILTEAGLQAHPELQEAEKQITDLLQEVNCDFRDFAYCKYYGYSLVERAPTPLNEEKMQEVDNHATAIFNTACEAFKTKTGLEITLGFHDCDNDGSRYDDVDGAFWCVEGAITWTDNGFNAMSKGHIIEANWAVFG